MRIFYFNCFRSASFSTPEYDLELDVLDISLA